MKYRSADNDSRYSSLESLDSLEGYLRFPKFGPSQTLPNNHCLVIILNETKPALRAVRQVIIRNHQICDPSAPIRVAGLSGYHMRPLGQITARKNEEAVQVPLREIRNGQAYKLISPAERNMVTPGLAQALEKVFETFAARCGFTAQNPVSIELTRGYEAGDRGHGHGMAADIQAVGGQSIAYWAQEFAMAMAQAKFIEDELQLRSLIAQQTTSNLGYLLYRTLLAQGGWRVYNQVVQLFGPWTPRLGPWKRLHFEHPDEVQKRLLFEQERIYLAHRDHIHVAFG